MKNLWICLLAIIVVLSLQAAPLQAQKMSIMPGIGISIPTGSTGNYWSTGFSAGGNLFYNFSPYLSLGARIFYNSWKASGDKWRYWLGSEYKLNSISGHKSIIELVPSVKISPTKNKNSSVNLFFQTGFGLYRIKRSTITLKGSYSNYYGSGTAEMTIEDFEPETKSGFYGSIGLVIAKHILIQPLYTIIFTEDGKTKYFSITIGYTK